MTLGDLARLSVAVGVALLIGVAWWGFRRRHRHEWTPWRIVRTAAVHGPVEFPGQKDIWQVRRCECGEAQVEWIDRTVRI